MDVRWWMKKILNKFESEGGDFLRLGLKKEFLKLTFKVANVGIEILG